MPSIIQKTNAGSIALQEVYSKYRNLPKGMDSPVILSKTAPYFGYVNIEICDCPPFVMFSNNDDFVAKNYFWNGADAYEPMSLKLWLALAKSSAFIFDIGAYTGLYSLSAASQNRKCKIFAFEALDTIYSRTLINKAANNLANINIYHAAVSDNEGTVDFNIYAGDDVLSSGSSICDKQHGRSVFHTKSVRAVKLDQLMDELNLSRVDLIKIDAEGAEHLIFKGAESTLGKHTPDILCEFLEGAETKELEKMLSDMGYRFFSIDEKKMSVDLTDGIVIGSDMNTLNTLITMKTADQISTLLSD